MLAIPVSLPSLFDEEVGGGFKHILDEVKADSLLKTIDFA